MYADKYAFDAQAPARQTIDSRAGFYKTLARRWTEIENSGHDDRDKITSYASLLTGRDASISIAQEISKAFPAPGAAELAKPRNERRVVDLVGWTMRYEPNISGLISKTLHDDEFNQSTDHVDISSAPGANQLMPTGGGFGAPSVAPAAAGGPGQRGYMVTILCRTTAADPTPFVSETVVNYLRGRNQGAANPPQNISIERVTIPSKVKVSAAYPGGLSHPKRGAMTFTPPASLDPAGGAAPHPISFRPRSLLRARPMIRLPIRCARENRNVMIRW